MSDQVKIGDKVFSTLVAITYDEQAKGLMFQKNPPVMSFVYARPGINSFWMKNTPAPLDMVFCLNNKVLAIYSGEPNSTKIVGNHITSDLIVEFPAGTCESLGIKAGDDILLELSDTSKMKLFGQKNYLR